MKAKANISLYRMAYLKNGDYLDVNSTSNLLKCSLSIIPAIGKALPYNQSPGGILVTMQAEVRVMKMS